MFFQELALAGDVPAVAFCQHVLPKRFDGLPGDHVGADRRLDGDVEHLAADDLAHLRHHRPAPVLRLGAVHDDGQRVHLLAVQQDVDLHHVGRAVLLELVVHRGVAAAHRLQLVEEVQHDLAQRQLVREHHLAAVVGHVDLHAALLVGERHDRPDVLLRHVEVHRDDRLADLLDAGLVRHLGRVLDHDDLAVVLHDLVDHARRGRDQVLVELALQPLLHDVHVQQAQEAAAEAEAERLAHLGLVVQRGVVELELLQAVAQRVVLVRLHRVEAGEHLRLDLLEAGQRLGGGEGGATGAGLHERDRVAHLGRLQFLDAGDDVADLARLQRLARHVRGREHAELVRLVGGLGGHQLDAVALGEAAVHHAHKHHHADVAVEPAVDDHRAQRGAGVAARRRNARDDRLQDLVDAQARLGGARDRVARVDADHVLDLLLRALGVGLRQVHLVQDRHDFHAEVERRVAVGHRLRFHALARIDHQQRALARGERAAHLVREVDVARRVDQIEVVDLSVTRLVRERGGLRLDGYPTLLFEIHRVEHLLFHLAIGEAAATLDQAVGERRFAVVDVRDDREVSDVIHQRERSSD